jgi:hypothetical protein
VASDFPVDQLAAVPGDPLAYLEERRLAYVAEIERCAMRCLIPADRAAIMLKLAKLTSLGKVSVDVHATLERLQPEPDLRQLTRDDLAKLLEDQRDATEAVATSKPAPDAD